MSNEKNNTPKTYSFDIDGTICTNTWGDYEKAEVIEKTVNQINYLYDKGNKIILFTARGTTTKIDWKKLTELQLSKWGVNYHQLIFGKPEANYYIDDKGLSIDEWSETFKNIKKSLENKNIDDNLVNDDIIKDSKYLSILYDEEKRPKTNYPSNLANHISKKFYKKRGSLLELGCGRGDFVKAFYDHGYDVVGSDISPATPDLISPHPCVVADIESNPLPIKDNNFDFLFSKSVIEHLRNPMPFLKESHRVLKPDGCATILTPSWVHHGWGPFYLDYTHVTPFTKFSLKNAMQMAGFTNIKVYHFYQLPFLWKYPFLKPGVKLFSKLPLRYRPMYDTKLPLLLNNLIRFSKEVMLLAVAYKPSK